VQLKLAAVQVDKIEAALGRFNCVRREHPIAAQPEINDAWNDVIIALNECGFDTSKGMMRGLKGGT
jgi:hypothetical protein